MITYIFLGLILGVVIISFIILNNKLLKITNILATITEILNNEVSTVTTIIELFKKLVERFSERVSTDNKNYYNLIELLKSRFKDLDNATDSIYDRFNTIHADIEKYIAAEHIITRKQIEKQAKISSKINSKRKQSNNTQK